MRQHNNQNLQPENNSRRQWLKSVGLGAGAVALTSSVDSFVKDLHAAGMPTEHFPSATPNVNDGLVRLSSNENAFGPSKKAAKAMQSELLNLARYTDATVDVLAKKIAKQEGVLPEQVVITNGSSPILLIRLCVWAIVVYQGAMLGKQGIDGRRGFSCLLYVGY